MRVIPSKSQWNKWTLPSKATYLGVCVTILSFIIQVLFSPFGDSPDKPTVSILSLESLFHEDSMESKFVIKNTGKIPAFIVINGQANIDDKTIDPLDSGFETQPIMLTPGQVLRYRGLTIQGSIYQGILSGARVPEITQRIRIGYGSSESKTNERHLFQKVKLDTRKLAHLEERSQAVAGLWLLVESGSK